MSSTLLCLVHFLHESSGFGDDLNKWAEVSEWALRVCIHEILYWTMHSVLPCTHDDYIEICHCLSYVYWTVHHLDSWIRTDQLDDTCFIISLFTAQHVSNVSTSIFRCLRLIVDLFHGLYCSGSMCVGVTVWFGWGDVVSLCRLNLMTLALLFHYLPLNMFRMLVHPSSGAYDLLWIYFMCCIAL
jgi:hypothetical protein